ncbi:MAG: nucleotidyltransferase family protein [Bacteroidetes bacterium]|nr:nucleotidyltransferase family protein [Bacteroidota bacterium]
MHTKEEIIQFLRNNKNFLREKFHLTKIGVFGSFARGDQKPTSDVDILIELEDGTKNIFDLEYDLQELLKKQFNREVDLVHEKSIRSYFKPFILRDAIYV